MKITEARKLIAAAGCHLENDDGEYRVNFKGGKEATAYYTNDLDDAVSTAQAMQAHKSQWAEGMKKGGVK